MTDASALKAVRHTRLTPKLVRWIEYVDSFDFEIQNIPGSKNPVADLLSRSPLPVDPEAIDMTEEDRPQALLLALDSKTDVAKLQREDPFFSNIVRVLQTNDLSHPKFRL